MIGAILAFSFGFATREEMPKMFFIIIVSAIGGVLLEFIIRFFFMPPKMAKQSEVKMASVEKIFNEVHDRIEAAHKGHIELLESQIKTLQTQLDDRAKKLDNEEKLGNLHQLLLSRAHDIRKMSASEYCKKYADSKEDNRLDPDTQFLFEGVERFLEKEIKGASASRFRNPENLKETPVDRPDYSTKSGPMADVAYKFYTEELYQQRVIDHLNHRASNLMKIIENKGENK